MKNMDNMDNMDYNMEAGVAAFSDVLSHYDEKDLSKMMPVFKGMTSHVFGDQLKFAATDEDRAMVAVAMADAGLTLSGSAEYDAMVVETCIRALEGMRQQQILPSRIQLEIAQLETLKIAETTAQLLAQIDQEVQAHRAQTDKDISKNDDKLRLLASNLKREREMIAQSYEDKLLTRAQENEYRNLVARLEQDERRLLGFFGRNFPSWVKPKVTVDEIRQILGR